MVSSPEVWEGDDDLARQRRKRDTRLLDEHLVDYPALTIADVVAEVLAASDDASRPLDVRTYLVAEGHHWRTIEAVVEFMHRNYVPDAPAPGPTPTPTPPPGRAPVPTPAQTQLRLL